MGCEIILREKSFDLFKLPKPNYLSPGVSWAEKPVDGLQTDLSAHQ